ncbi:MAG: hypothetical protein JXA90_10470, partial [Planctomycetes bacterium]|nr:hypothetical protein [Planctomycetota bacterium]
MPTARPHLAARARPLLAWAGLRRPAALLFAWAALRFLAALVIVLLAAAWCRGAEASPPGEPATALWWEDLEGTLRLEPADAEAIVRGVRDALARGDAGVEDLPARWAADRAARIVFLSATDGSRPARVAMGAGRGLGAALEASLRELLRRGVRDRDAAWVKLDVVSERSPRRTYLPGVPLAVEKLMDGVAFSRDLSLAFLPLEVASHGLVDVPGRWLPSRLGPALAARGLPAALRNDPRWRKPSAAWTFRTESWFAGGGEIFRLQRGHRRVEDVDPPRLLGAARAGGEYLRRAVSPDGRFTYSYRPLGGIAEDDYNLVRHAGTVYAMYELLEEAGDAGLLAAAERAADYLLRFVQPFGEAEDGMSILASEDRVKLGGVALAIVALVQRSRVTGDRGSAAVLERLGRYLLHSQRDDGSFVHERHLPSGRPREDFVSDYYPGEALLALLRLNAFDGGERWLEAAERGARYLIRVRDRGVETRELIHDHWLLYALSELYRRRPGEEYLEHAMRICEAIIARQTVDSPHADLRGSYGDPPRSTPAATRSEGLLAAHRMASGSGRADLAQRILEAARRGVAFQLRTQLGPGSTLHLEDPRAPL